MRPQALTTMRILVISGCAVAALGTATHADVITITATGDVVWNDIQDGALGAVQGGEAATVSFNVDSNNFIDGAPGDLRSYEIVHGSFVLSFDSASVSLMDPFPQDQTPYFTIMDGFPVSDGFFVSTSLFSPGGVALSQDPYQFDMNLGYGGDTLDSVDILDAMGTYGYDGMTRFSMGVWAFGPDNVVLGIDWTGMTITPAPSSLALLGLGGFAAIRRRR